MDSTPVWESAPPVVTVKSPVIVAVPSSKALLSVSQTFPPDTAEMAPVKLFTAVSSLISFVPVVIKLVAPTIESAPACEIAPVLIALKVFSVITGNVNADETS